MNESSTLTLEKNLTPGQRLRLIREERKLTQVQLGALANLQDEHISMMENDKRTIGVSTGCRLAKALDVSLSELLGV